MSELLYVDQLIFCMRPFHLFFYRMFSFWVLASRSDFVVKCSMLPLMLWFSIVWSFIIMQPFSFSFFLCHEIVIVLNLFQGHMMIICIVHMMYVWLYFVLVFRSYLMTHLLIILNLIYLFFIFDFINYFLFSFFLVPIGVLSCYWGYIVRTYAAFRQLLSVVSWMLLGCSCHHHSLHSSVFTLSAVFFMFCWSL